MGVDPFPIMIFGGLGLLFLVLLVGAIGAAAFSLKSRPRPDRQGGSGAVIAIVLVAMLLLCIPLLAVVAWLLLGFSFRVASDEFDPYYQQDDVYYHDAYLEVQPPQAMMAEGLAEELPVLEEEIAPLESAPELSKPATEGE